MTDEAHTVRDEPEVERPRWSALPLLWLIRIYQRFISPLTPATCRFYPSCSAYAVTALRRHGLVKGSWLAMRRLMRCHPWNPGGVDHVPPRAPRTDSAHPATRPVSGSAHAMRKSP